MTELSPCPFCNLVKGKYVALWGETGLLHRDTPILWIKPINPVVDGHILIVPAKHFETADENPPLFGSTMWAASVWARDRFTYQEPNTGYNIIQSNGRAATQTIKHLHVHIVPRRVGDGLKLPWSI